MKRKMILMLILTCLFSLTSRADEPLSVLLKDKVRVENNRITLNDLINEDGTDVEFVQRYGKVPLSSLGEQEQKITQTKLLALLYKSGVDVSNIRFKNSANIELERGQEVTLPPSFKSRLSKDLSRTYNIPLEAITLGLARVLPALKDPDYQLMQIKKILPRDLKNLARAHFEIHVQNLDGEVVSHDLYLALKINVSAYTAKEFLSSGSTVTTQDFTRGKILLTALDRRLASPNTMASNVSYKLTREIPQNGLLMENMLREISLVEEGSAVVLSYKTPMLRVQTQGKLLESAEIGKMVRAENMDSKRSVTGVLVAKDLVEVSHVN